MTKKPRRLLRAVRDLGALYVSHSLTTLGLVRRTVQNLSNQVDPNVCTRGCDSCGLIYQIDVHFLGGVDSLDFCPGCKSDSVFHLEEPPVLIKGKGGYYLEGSSGFRIGPFTCSGCAYEHLWKWFEAKEKEDANKESDKKDGQKGHKKDGKKIYKKPKVEHLNVVREGRPEGGHNRRVGSSDADGEEVEGKDPDPES